MQFPRVYLVRQNFPDRQVADVPGTVRNELAVRRFSKPFEAGSRVAIGVGSRGIANIATIVRSVVEYWKDAGHAALHFPGDGQPRRRLPRKARPTCWRTTESSRRPWAARSSARSKSFRSGQTADGIETFMDRNAFESDGVMLVGRVKWHTDFAGKIESGLFKMMAIGLGKFAGAQHYHTYAYKLGLEHVIRSIGRQVLESGKILGGLAILEDANHNTAQLTAVPVEADGAEGRGAAGAGEILDGPLPVDLARADPR